MKKGMIGAVAALALGAAAVVAAPVGDRGPAGKSGGEHHRRGQGPLEKLNLTDAQKEQIKSIRTTFREQNKAFFEAAGATRQQMHDARKANDTAKLEALEGKAVAQRAQMKQLREAEKTQIRAVLNAEQRAQFDAMAAAREERGERGRRGGRHGKGGRDGAFLAEKLNLTDAQKAQIKSIRESSRAQNQALFETGRALREELRAARQAGDTAKLEALRPRMEAQHEQMRALHEAQRAKIGTVLTAEQKAQLDAMKAQRGERGRR